MPEKTSVETMIAALDVGVTRTARQEGMAKLTPLHRERVETMPQTKAQEVRVLFARLDPGDTTPHHSHRFPVTVYVTAGAFTLELEGRAPVTIRAGEALVEPAHVKMTGRNLDEKVPAEMALFYVCEPDAPFADPA